MISGFSPAKSLIKLAFGGVRLEVLGLSLEVSSPEDTILMKLKWARQSGGSQKHSVDALRVYEVNREFLNLKYLGEWVSSLGLQEQ